jgi:hypothetical protein
MRILSFRNTDALSSAARRVIADLGVIAFPLVGVSAAAGKLSCFVEIPPGAVKTDPTRVFRTQLRIRGYSELMLSVAELIDGNEPFGFLLADRSALVSGEQYQPDDSEKTIAIVPELRIASGSRLIGPPRCGRCNHAIPPARARLIGSSGLCIHCQSQSERVQ